MQNFNCLVKSIAPNFVDQYWVINQLITGEILHRLLVHAIAQYVPRFTTLSLPIWKEGQNIFHIKYKPTLWNGPIVCRP